VHTNLAFRRRVIFTLGRKNAGGKGDFARSHTAQTEEWKAVTRGKKLCEGQQ
jgi:hypothetical protein